MKKRISILLVILIIIASIPAQSVYAFTPEDFIGNLDWSKMTDTEKWGCIFNFTVAEIGAVVNGDAASFIYGMSAMSDFMNNNDPDDYVKEDEITIPKDYVALVKQCLDQYSKEHEPYTMYQTIPLSGISYTAFNEQKNVYDSLKNLIADSPSGVIGITYLRTNGTFRFTDIGSHLKDICFVKYFYNGYRYRAEVKAYDIETWNHATYPRYELVLGSEDAAIKNKDDFISRATTTYTEYNQYIRFYCMADDAKIENLYNDSNSLWIGNQVSNILLSNDSRRIRVYNTYADFQDYTLGKRTVYYTSNYYNYVPEDITVSIDDLQKEIDDLSKVIDKLLEQISKDTDENEIEELLQLILEELRKNPGGSGGSSGGDVTVNVDMTQTNSWLAKIYAKIVQIYDKMNATVEDAEDAALAKIQESLDEIIVQLKKIKHWSAVDTVIDGVDAIADWLDLIRGVISDAKEGAGSAVAALSSAVGDSVDLMAKKFPFSIPWDILFFVSVLSAEPQIPHFEIPFNIEFSALDITIDYTMKLDFEQFQWLSDLSRLLLSMTYAVGLLKLTFGVTSAGKEE